VDRAPLAPRDALVRSALIDAIGMVPFGWPIAALGNIDGGGRGLWDAAPVPRNYFDERIARSYQAKWPELFEPGVVDPAVRFLAGPAGTGAALELGVPGLQRLPAGETLRAFAVTPEHLGFEEYAAATDRLLPHYWVVDGQLETFSTPFRLVWPSELDLMARLAGMSLRERWSDWSRAPFTSDSTTHVSVWEKPA